MSIRTATGRKPGRFFLILAAALVAGCDDGKKPTGGPASAGPTVIVEDAACGLKLAVPEGWKRRELNSYDPRTISAAYGPPTDNPVEGIFVMLMSPGVPARDFGSRFAGKSVVTSNKPEQYRIAESGERQVGSRPGYSIHSAYKGDLGPVFEAAAYVESTPGAGYLIVSRAPSDQEGLARARLDATLAAFELVARQIVTRPPADFQGGFRLGLPEGFEVQTGPAAAGLYALGPRDVDRHEAITVLILPGSPGSSVVEASMLQGLTREGEPVKLTVLGVPTEAALYRVGEKESRYEMALATALLPDGTRTGILVNGAKWPSGRALEILKATASTLTWKRPATPKLIPMTFGEGRNRISLVPEGHETKEGVGLLVAGIFEDAPGVTGEDKKRSALHFIEILIEPDRTGRETPMALIKNLIGLVDKRKKPLLLPAESLTLPDGRTAARLVVLTAEGAVDTTVYARVSPGAMARVRILCRPWYAPGAPDMAMAILAGTRYAALDEIPKPEEAVAKASREALPGVVNRARAMKLDSTYWVFESREKDQDPWKATGAVKMRTGEDGAWVEESVRPLGKASVTVVTEARPNRLMETLTWTGEKGGSTCVTTLDSTGEWLDISRRPDQGDERRDRVAKTDLFLPPDISGTDRGIVAMAAEPEGTYSFQVISTEWLTPRYLSISVKGEEELDGPEGKFRARRIELGGSVYFVMGDRIVMAEEGRNSRRRIATEDEAKKFLK